MKKKSILMAAIAVMLVAVLVVGGTLAYFTDKTDVVDNVFTTGNVKIAVQEEFEQNSKLVPGTNDTNTVKKVVNVKNAGSEDAFVRVHIAIPAALVDQDINAYNDMLHMNFTGASAADGKWSWHPKMCTGNGWTDNGRANNNTYNTMIDGVEYTVWVVTYRTALKQGEVAEGAISQVYLDKFVEATVGEDGAVTYTKPFFTDKQGGTVDPEKTMTYTVPANGFQIKVIAEGVQAEGFSDAYAALNTAFGTPGAKGYVSPFTK